MRSDLSYYRYERSDLAKKMIANQSDHIQLIT